MIIRPALPPDASLPERINEMVERMRVSTATGTLPIEVALGAVPEDTPEGAHRDPDPIYPSSLGRFGRSSDIM